MYSEALSKHYLEYLGIFLGICVQIMPIKGVRSAKICLFWPDNGLRKRFLLTVKLHDL